MVVDRTSQSHVIFFLKWWLITYKFEWRLNGVFMVLKTEKKWVIHFQTRKYYEVEWVPDLMCRLTDLSLSSFWWDLLSEINGDWRSDGLCVVNDRIGLLPNRTDTDIWGKKITEPNRYRTDTESTDSYRFCRIYRFLPILTDTEPIPNR